MSDFCLSPRQRGRPPNRLLPLFRVPRGAFFISLGFLLLWTLLLKDPGAAAGAAPESLAERAARHEKQKKTRGGNVDQKGRRPTGDKEKGEAAEATAEGEEGGLFLPEAADNQTYLPDIFRCPECGYEQDEPGTCPDHGETELIKVLSKGKNPLAPPELDGNEDLLVDVPLTGLVLRKTPTPVASGTAGAPAPGAPPRVPPKP